LTLTFELIRASDQTRLACEFGANPFSGSRDISYTSKKVTDIAKRTLYACGSKTGPVLLPHYQLQFTTHSQWEWVPEWYRGNYPIVTGQNVSTIDSDVTEAEAWHGSAAWYRSISIKRLSPHAPVHFPVVDTRLEWFANLQLVRL